MQRCWKYQESLAQLIQFKAKIISIEREEIVGCGSVNYHSAIPNLRQQHISINQCMQGNWIVERRTEDAIGS